MCRITVVQYGSQFRDPWSKIVKVPEAAASLGRHSGYSMTIRPAPRLYLQRPCKKNVQSAQRDQTVINFTFCASGIAIMLTNSTSKTFDFALQD
jgi:hypothetical protein